MNELADAVATLEVPTWFWEAFVAGVVGLLVLDLFVFHRRPHEVRAHEAVGWTIFWIALALLFNGWVWWEFGRRPALDFFQAYILEKALSVDNLFVFLLIFQYFKVPPELQHRVLFFGVLGAIVTRFVFISVGIALVSAFEWVMYVFGAFLLFTAVKLLFRKEADKDPSKLLVVRLVRRVVPFVPEYDGRRLTTRRDGRRVATMLLLVILVVESTDVVFAVDSIPAVIGVTREKFIVFTSNVFAILGLRSIYFLLARFMGEFRYLEPGLALVLGFIGLKMFDVFHISSEVSLAIIGGILLFATVASLLHPHGAKRNE
jgi:TerC family integral membrane protein